MKSSRVIAAFVVMGVLVAGAFLSRGRSFGGPAPIPTPSPPASVPVATGPSDAASSTSPGCGASAPSARGTSYVTREGRTFHVWGPATYDANRAYPVVLTFHGWYTNGRDFQSP